MSKSLSIALAEFATFSSLLAGLVAAPDLPEIFNLRVCEDIESQDNPLGIEVLLAYPPEVTELAEIETVQAWAVALGGVLLLGDPKLNADGSATMRRLSAIKRLPTGGLFEAYTWIAKTPTPVLESLAA